MQNVGIPTRPFPSAAVIAGALTAIIATVVLMAYGGAQLGSRSTSASSAPVVTKSVGSQLVRHNASERSGAPEQPSEPVLRLHGPR